MNNPIQFNQPGSVSELRNRGRARVRVAVFVVLSIHVVGLMALLMQGCKREEAPPPTGATNAPPVFEPTNVPPAETNVPAVTPPVAAPVPAPVLTPPAGTTEYTVAPGDTFYSIGKKFGVGYKAIEAANPNVDPKKLKPGQKIQIPAATSGAGAPAAPGAGPAATEAGGNIYVVKSGDTLTKIAAQFGVTVRSLRSANNLTTDRITVGQKLKIPVKAGVPAPITPAAPTEPAPATPAPATAPPAAAPAR
jgi:LysM repeat protein